MHAAVLELFRMDAGSPEYAPRARAASPATYLHRSPAPTSLPPVLLVHGGADTIVPADDSRSFHRELQAAGVASALVELPGESHGFAVLSRREALLPATCAVLTFLRRVLAP
jgi:dipeptidyl aminopeptidase/acylaminoacyl peptidase